MAGRAPGVRGELGRQRAILAGRVAFFAFLAIFPAIIAAFTLYGLFADPQTVGAQVRDLSAALPQQAQPIVADQTPIGGFGLADLATCRGRSGRP